MAKGRKLNSSRSERLLGSFGYGQRNGGGGSPEFREEDVWSMVENGTDSRQHWTNGAESQWTPRASVESSRHRRTAPPMASGSRRVGGLSLAFDEYEREAPSSPRVVHQHRGQENGSIPGATAARGGHRHVGMATSAPVNVPDWGKIVRVNSVESINEARNDEEDDSGSEWVPPHEYLARSRKSAATSVFEGVGRTLKGRDLSRVRDAVWSQTGFDG